MNDLGPWLRAHWQLIAAPALTVAIIGFAMLWLRPAAPEVTGPQEERAGTAEDGSGDTNGSGAGTGPAAGAVRKAAP